MTLKSQQKNPIKRQSKARRQPGMIALEPRVLFDGAALATAIDTQQMTDAATTGDTSLPADANLSPEFAAAIADAPTAADTPVTLDPNQIDGVTSLSGAVDTSVALSAPAGSIRNELVVVDGSLDNLQILLDDIRAADPNRTVLVLDPARDEVTELTNYLQQHNASFDAIHLFSHGGTGWLGFAGQAIMLSTPEQNTALWDSVKTSLAEQGDILLYGCNIASTPEAVGYINNLASITGADIAVSTNDTGATGDWILESTVGNLETTTIASPNWQGDLVVTAVTNPLAGGEQIYVPFVITGTTGDTVSLQVLQGSAGGGLITIVDPMTNANVQNTGYANLGATPIIQYLDATTNVWKAYAAGSLVAITSPDGTLKVRVDIHNEWVLTSTALIDGPEQFTLKVTSGSTVVNGICTIKDDWDGDGKADRFDADADNDAIPNSVECPTTVPTYGPDYWNAPTGNSYYDSKGTSSVADDEIVITVDAGYQRGAIWAKNQLNLGVDFVMTAQLFLGYNDAGADGIAFVLQNRGTAAIGGYGGGLGYEGLATSLAVEFDTWDNGAGYGDIPNDHVSIQYNAPYNVLSGAVSLGNIEDGRYHNVEINWNAVSKQMIVKWDGVERIRMNRDIVATIFGSNPNVYFGFVGSTGGAQNLQKVKDLRVGVAMECLDTDRDTIPDLLDSDSDNDGFPDAIDATRTVAGTSNTGTSPFVPQVNNIIVNEGSPYVVFDVTAAEREDIKLSLSGGTATLGTDTGTQIQYWTGTTWANYTLGTYVQMPSDGDAMLYESTTLKVRVAIVNDAILDNGETFTLKAENAGGGGDTGTATIMDDGSGTKWTFASANVIGTATSGPGIGFDDDRPLSVSNVTVSESSPYAVFSVTGAAYQKATLALATGTATSGTDYTASLEVWDPSGASGAGAWVSYTAGSLVTLNEDGQVLVRTAIKPDTIVDNNETFKLTASTTSGVAATGTATIKDDGSGTIFTADNPATTTTNESAPSDSGTTLTPATSSVSTASVYIPGTTLDVLPDDDRKLSVNSLTVNEGSPYALFTVTGGVDQYVKLALSNGTALMDANGTPLLDGTEDYGPNLEYWDGSAWQAYTTNSYVKIPGGGTTLNVRTQIINDTVADNSQTFTLSASNVGGATAVTGTATIKDDGTGTKWSFTGTNDIGTSTTGPGPGFDDDRALTSVSSPTVNEGSPYVVFTVTGVAGQYIKLSTGITASTSDVDASLTAPNADIGTLEYYNGTTWVPYTPDAYVQIPTTGTTLLVRTAITHDTASEGAETFTLSATNTGGNSTVTGTATIKDDGTGQWFTGTSGTGTATAPAGSVLDDDRPLSVTSVGVNEASPYAVFTVSGAANQLTTLGLADQNSDGSNLTALQYFNGSSWVNYTSGAVSLGASGSLLVRVAIAPEQDLLSDNAETFSLVATNTGGSQAKGTGTIYDDGTGNIFLASNNTATPSLSNATGYPALDDDRPVSVNSPTVNEASPFAVFELSGAAGQKVSVALAAGTSPAATGDGVDYGLAATGSDLQISTDDGATWTTYTTGGSITLDASGKALVRTSIVNDPNIDNNETFKLNVTSTGGVVNTGVATIKDDGTGTIFTDSGAADTSAIRDDDRPLSVSSLTVNEGSHYAVFTVTGGNNQIVKLALSGTSSSAPDAAGGAAYLTGDYDNNVSTAETLPALEYLEGGTWKTYDPTNPPKIASNATTLLVRVAISAEQDASLDGPETFSLVATNTANVAATGTATIKDDGTGGYFAADNNTATSTVPTGVTLDDDRALTVTAPTTVNEESPYAVFTVTGAAGQLTSLSLNQDSDGQNLTALQYFNGSSWVNYTSGTVPLNASGQLLVRVALSPEQDDVSDNAETFSLVATNTGGTAATGTTSIVDDGTGSYFASANNTATSAIPAGVTLDDDRGLTFVSSPTVNEGSPYAVFTVTANAGQYVKLNLGTTTAASGNADLISDTGNSLQYFNGTTWVAYTPNSYVQVTADGTLLVRTAIANDSTSEGAETFTLSATNTGGNSTVTGTATIKDDGSGNVYLADNNTATPNSSADAGYPAALDDDRPLTVNSPTVNEASPYIVYAVTGAAGQSVSLSLGASTDTATIGTDTVNAGTDTDTPPLQYFNGTGWVDYTPNSLVQIPTVNGTPQLLVRTGVKPDTAYEMAETLSLVATNDGGTAAVGTGTIRDDGTGGYFAADNNTATSSIPSSVTLDDDRANNPPYVNSILVNEGSTYAVFTVSGLPDAKVLLTLPSYTAFDAATPGSAGATGADYTASLKVWDPSGASGVGAWVSYDATNPPTLLASSNGTLMVRVPILSDSVSDNNERFQINVAYDKESAHYPDGSTLPTILVSSSTDGYATIKDDGTGSIFTSGNPTTVNGILTPATSPVATAAVYISGATAGTLADDDRTLSVSSPTVNEASPYAVFSVSAFEGQYVKLSLGAMAPSGSASLGNDTGNSLEYWNGSAWVPYTTNSYVKVPSDGDVTPNEATSLLVRVAIKNDVTPEGAETFTLTAYNTTGAAASGTGTITDDGTGDVFLASNNTATPSLSTVTGYPTLDDDRTLTISPITINEVSPFAVFTVTGANGQKVMLDLASGTATVSTDTANAHDNVQLQYLVGSTWTDYTPGSYVTLSGSTLLVRTAIVNDTASDNNEIFKLNVTNTGGTAYVGTATITDDASGSLFSANNTSGIPDSPGTNGLPTQLDDDRVMSVSSPTVNEGSPYAVFTITGGAGQLTSLALTNQNSDGSNLTSLQYYNGSAWVDYSSGTVPLDASGQLLVRVALSPEQEETLDGPETFTLVATNTTGTASTGGTGTIVDDGTGSYFALDNNTATSSVPTGVTLDDDRALSSVSSPTVNEGSGFVVFTVTGNSGQYVNLATGNTATNVDVDASLSADTGNSLQYYNGTSWEVYTPNSYVQIPTTGTTLLVRTAITNDTSSEGAETFTLSATNSGGNSTVTGTATIIDDGTGSLFSSSNTTGTPDAPGTNGAPAQLNDDRGLTSVSSPTVNEGSPYAVFTVTGTAVGQFVSLSLANGSADGADYGNTLQYFDGTTWQSYTAGSFVQITDASKQLLVRTTIVNDGSSEGAQTFTLSATNTGGNSTVTGTATIKDDGSGNVYLADNNTATPNSSSDAGYLAALDDDRPVSVSSFSVNEGSPYAVFELSGIAGQLVNAALADGTSPTATDDGVDYGLAEAGYDLQVSTDGGANWVGYTPGALITLDSSGKALIRTFIVNDSPIDNNETFKLNVSNTGGVVSTGIATIKDDGSGVWFDGTNGSGSATAPVGKVLDDDRLLTVTSPTVNEGSPYVVFTVTGASNQTVNLALSGAAGDYVDSVEQPQNAADLGATPVLQYFEGGTWKNYDPANPSKIGNAATTLLVRVAISAEQEAAVDGPETFSLVATNTGGTAATGTATIKDDGTGTKWSFTTDSDPGSSVTAIVPTAGFDDDRAVTVNDIAVNEASPTAVLEVTGGAGQLVTLALVDGSTNPATGDGVDFGVAGTLTSDLEVSTNGGATWVTYTAGNQVALDVNGKALVRTVVVNDSLVDNKETFKLNITSSSNVTVTGTATLHDDGTGTIFNANGTQNTTVLKDDDRPLSVNNVDVNEGSEYAVFKVTGAPDQQTVLSLPSAGQNADSQNLTVLDYYNGTDWIRYVSGAVSLDRTGNLLVRVALNPEHDATVDNGETFTLVAANTAGTTFSGVGTIHDDGTGDLFGWDNTTGNGDTPGLNGAPAQRDDDRPVTVNSFDVNEASPYAVFTVEAHEGQLLKLALAENTALAGIDYFNVLQYWNGSAWVNYTADSFIAVPSDGDATPNETAKLLVRVAIINDTPSDDSETFSLNVYNTGGQVASGVAKIRDNDTGLLFASDNNTGLPDAPGTHGLLAQLDFDRNLRPTVTNLTVNEGSPYAVFSVAGLEGQYLQFELSSGTATAGADFVNAIEYFDGTKWQQYTPGDVALVPSNGNAVPNETVKILVRVKIINDALQDKGETFTLKAINALGQSAVGTATIMDDATGDLYGSGNTTGVPDAPGANGAPSVKDDDRPIINAQAKSSSGGVSQTTELKVAEKPVELGQTEFNAIVLDFNGSHSGSNQFRTPVTDTTMVRAALAYSSQTPYAHYDRVGYESNVLKGTGENAQQSSNKSTDMGLRNVLPLPDVAIGLDGSVTYRLPANTFTGGKGEIRLVAQLADGKPLPDWMKFDPKTGVIQADVPLEKAGPIELKIIATDDKGDQASTKLRIKPGSNKMSLRGKPTFTAQLRHAMRLRA